MDWLEAVILGLVQGLTEFLPVSSSGHLELGKAILDVNPEKSLIFTIVVHGATVLSTIVVFYKELWQLIKGVFAFRWNWETKYVAMLVVSMIPVAVVGFLMEEEIEKLFDGNVRFVGIMLLITAGLLMLTYLRKKNTRNLNFLNSFIIGISQMLAVIPGISRSGATISTGLILGVKKENVAQFSFLMVLVPIIGANIFSLLSWEGEAEAPIGSLPLIIGFITAFISGWIACKWMINIVKRGKLFYFAIYCFLVGLLAIFVI